MIDDLDLQALVDGELDGEDRARVEAAVRENPLLKERYNQLKLQKQLIFSAWKGLSRDNLH